MSRTYRGRREDNGRWVEGWYLLFTRGIDGDLHIIVDATGQYNRIEPETLGQCTGYLDMMGRLVYEGDIVYDGRDTYIVRYEDKLAGFVAEDNKSHVIWSLIELPSERIEIIGNAHEVQMKL